MILIFTINYNILYLNLTENKIVYIYICFGVINGVLRWYRLVAKLNKYTMWKGARGKRVFFGGVPDLSASSLWRRNSTRKTDETTIKCCSFFHSFFWYCTYNTCRHTSYKYPSVPSGDVFAIVWCIIFYKRYTTSWRKNEMIKNVACEKKIKGA